MKDKYGAEEIIKIVMRRDGVSLTDAKEMLSNCIEEIQSYLKEEPILIMMSAR